MAFQKCSIRGLVGVAFGLDFASEDETTPAAVLAQTFHHKGDQLFGDDQVARRVPEASGAELPEELVGQLDAFGDRDRWARHWHTPLCKQRELLYFNSLLTPVNTWLHGVAVATRKRQKKDRPKPPDGDIATHK
jgi:hypothetical protein